MFTGLIEEIGIVQSVHFKGDSAAIGITANTITKDLKVGDSVNTNGACLTVTSFSSSGFTVDAVAETMHRTNLSKLKSGDKVNLERALQLSDRLGGHMVSGHIDGTGTIAQINTEGNTQIVTIEAVPEIIKYIIEKGSIAIDGISLTVMTVNKSSFEVAIIPHTSNETTLISKEKGNKVNLECDMVGKYIERFLNLKEDKNSESKIDLGFLREHGF
jgi:riboflavin synthase